MVKSKKKTKEKIFEKNKLGGEMFKKKDIVCSKKNQSVDESKKNKE